MWSTSRKRSRGMLQGDIFMAGQITLAAEQMESLSRKMTFHSFWKNSVSGNPEHCKCRRRINSERTLSGKTNRPKRSAGELYHHRISDLITHTFICGGSGSGKTVMGKAIIEEAALRGVPAIMIDLKGDLSSLALSFPEISPNALAPWLEVEDKTSLGPRCPC